MSAPATQGMVSAAEIAAFYVSREWRVLSYRTKINRGRRCELCGRGAADRVKIISDHILPVRTHWHLRLSTDNLQVLCHECNLGKGSWDATDHRGGMSLALLRHIYPNDYCRIARETLRARLKRAIIEAFSEDALSQEWAIRLIHECRLVHA